LIKLLREVGLVTSGTEAQRNIEQGGVKVDGQRVDDKALALAPGQYVVQVGKRKFARVTVS
jgi:tyrosyl-tRNA synthetase